MILSVRFLQIIVVEGVLIQQNFCTKRKYKFENSLGHRRKIFWGLRCLQRTLTRFVRYGNLAQFFSKKKVDPWTEKIYITFGYQIYNSTKKKQPCPIENVLTNHWYRRSRITCSCFSMRIFSLQRHRQVGLLGEFAYFCFFVLFCFPLSRCCGPCLER